MPDSPPVRRLLDLDGQSVLVTGASGHIGGGIASRLAEAGAHVIAHYHENEAAARLLAERIGGDIARADLTAADAVASMFEEHRPDALVNNAAIQPVADLRDITPGDWRAMQASNLDSAFLATQQAAAVWRRAGRGGAVVNVASIEGLDPAEGHAHYATSKAALVMFTRAAALEYGGDDIRVNAVSPGLIDRDGLAADWPDGVGRWRERAPLGRLGTPNDVADAVLFLLGSGARWISGANLVVDGGMSAQSRW